MEKEVYFLARGRLKVEVLKLLNQPKTSTQIAKLLKRHRSAISRIFLDLEKKGLIKCLNPEDNMSRFYQITGKGNKVIKLYEKIINF